MLLRLLQLFEKATRSRGQSTLLYEDPDVTTIGDKELLKEMNKRVKENPDYILPENYYKVMEKEQIFNYVITDEVAEVIGESQKICIELLDDLIFNACGTHFLEAIVSYEHRSKVKPRIKQTNMALGPPALSYMVPVKRQFRPLVSQQQKLQQSMDESVQYKKPKLGIELKLALYQYQKTNPLDKYISQETAEVLEEILQAVEQGRENLPEREKIKYTKDVWNKAKEEKQKKELEERSEAKKREEKRKKRQIDLQEELNKLKDSKEAQLEDSKRRKEESEVLQKAREVQEREERKRKLEERKIQIEEKKSQRFQELEQRKQEEDSKKEQDKKEKVREQKDFLIKQKDKLGQEFQLRKKEKDEAEKAKTDFEEWKKEKQVKVKNQMENYLKQNKESSHKEEKERGDIAQFMKDAQVQKMFKVFEKGLEQMFKFYASQDKKQIGVYNLTRMNFNEFIKFGYQTNITPIVIPNEEMVYIFRALIREIRESLTQKELDELGLGVNSLAVEDFKKGLVRIAILGQELLGGSGGVKLEQKLLEMKSSAKPPKMRMQSRDRQSSAAISSTSRAKLKKQNSTSGLVTQNTANKDEQFNSARQGSLTRKTKEQKTMEEITKEKERLEKMNNIKIEDKRMTKEFDVSIITENTIEGLLKFIQLAPEDNSHKLDKKLNQQRIEIQGAKPNKVLKENVTHRLDEERGHVQDAQGQNSTSIEMSQQETPERQASSGNNEKIIEPNGEEEQWEIKE